MKVLSNISVRGLYNREKKMDASRYDRCDAAIRGRFRLFEQRR